jgi:tripartite-type tricarboxylate transporter receptor subunit TctC
MSADTNAALADAAIKSKLERMVYAPGGTTPKQLAIILQAEIDKWSAIIKAADIKID